VTATRKNAKRSARNVKGFAVLEKKDTRPTTGSPSHIAVALIGGFDIAHQMEFEYSPRAELAQSIRPLELTTKEKFNEFYRKTRHMFFEPREQWLLRELQEDLNDL
jgi:hypothetical protein